MIPTFTAAEMAGMVDEFWRLYDMPPDPLPVLPRWQSHKIVEADRITEVLHVPDVPDDRGTVTRWRLACGVVVDVSGPLESRVPPDVHSATAGYYVLYEDGYESWSPSGAFESGYSRLADNYETVRGAP
jgi:hypothetical protein